MLVIDGHCHLADEGRKRQSAADLLRDMDRLGVDRAVLCPSDAEIALHNQSGNERLAGLVREHPDRFTALAVASPWHGAHALDLLREAREEGLGGLKLHPPLQGFQLSDELADPLIEFCAAAGWAVYCHTGTPICAEPLQLAELARRHPAVSFIMGHMGWSDFAGDTLHAAGLAGNIHLETSHMAGTVIAAAVGALGAQRVLFGSDSPVSLLDAELGKLSLYDFAAADRAQLLGGTAARVYGIKP